MAAVTCLAETVETASDPALGIGVAVLGSESANSVLTVIHHKRARVNIL